MPLSNDINQVHEDLALIYTEAKFDWKKDHPNGPWPELNETHRPEDVQDAYFAQGRRTLVVVNRLRKIAGLGPITAAANENIITNALFGQSKHNTLPCEALDVRMRLYKKVLGKLVAAGIDYKTVRYYKAFAGYMIAAYQRLKKEGKIKTRMRWGGDWNGNGIVDKNDFDPPHFELY